MNYSETIDFLYTRLPMFSKTGSDAIKKGLHNIILLCNELDNPQNKFITIHIAGTNGKGSVSHLLASILQAAGYKTGLYTSPHLLDFRERIKIDGQMIPQQNVIDFVGGISSLMDTINPSFFEITVAMAFDYFALEKVDIAVIETGLGGRLDSTNIIHPILSVITNIAYDHTDLLGNTLTLIASEKAGIIKAKIPVVIGQAMEETRKVFEQKAVQENAPIIFAEEEWQFISDNQEGKYLNIKLQNLLSKKSSSFLLDLKGSYQYHNLITVLSAIHQLNIKGWKIDERTILTGLKHAAEITGLKGRWDIIQTNPLLIIDVGHNAHGIAEIVKQIALFSFKRLHIITGMVKDKDIESVLALLPQNAYYYFTKAQIPRALKEDILLQKASNYQLYGAAFTAIDLAIKTAIKNADTHDMILICGSVFVAGEAYEYLLKKNNMHQLIFATNNQHKVEEMNLALKGKYGIKSLKDAGINIDIPEPYLTLEENALTKARTIYQLTKSNCFSEDTGLEVAALNGEPGVKSARYAGDNASSEDNIDKLLNNMQHLQDRKAQFKTIITLILEGKEYLFEGICKGSISTHRKGMQGFGYDAVFIPEHSEKTFAEMTPAEKNFYSHRRKAADKLVEFLDLLEVQ